jgi:hypothetical protein
MTIVYIYVVARDFGFAPNPFHGVCTLATCKPVIRRVANEGDWVIGLGGSRLKATGRCIFAMQVTDTMSFDEYWTDPEYKQKRASRNGSRKAMVGDNIYHRVCGKGAWQQEDSHHSLPDGTIDPYNAEHDTDTNRILLSRRFLYFGKNAPIVPEDLLSKIGYQNARHHRAYDPAECADLLDWLSRTFANEFNKVSGDPFQFKQSGARYSLKTDRAV